MKRLFFAAIALVFAGTMQAQSTSATGETTPNTTAAVANASVDERTPVKIEDLPEAVKKSLAADKYKGWTAKAAYLVTEAGKKSYYEVEMAGTDSQKTLVKLDDQGVEVK